MMKFFQIVLAATLAFSFSASQPIFADTPTDQTPGAQSLAGGDMVMFNENSKKYHALSCGHLTRCTHCVKMKRSEALAQGGIPCKTCGGGD
ncbi:MAG: hypothetical protein SGJ27_01935 [Candidatus Melainabacteria bacterium]|nr:hypothetical protein [Candidatus Melainabacteria bacterium]